MRKAEITQLTGLRAIAAWSVVFFHSGYMLVSHRLTQATKTGYLGVDVFFVLSGFVIAYNYLDDPIGDSWKRWRNFYWMRFARLYPVHLFTLLVSLFFYAILSMSALHTRKDFSGWTKKSFVANVFMVHAWLPHPHDSWNNASWSVSCEWFAYLMFPLLVYAGIRRIPARLCLVLATLAAAVPAVALYVSSNLPCFALIEVLFEFAAGCLAYVAFKTLKSRSFVSYAAMGLLLAGVVAWVILRAFGRPAAERCLVFSFPLLVMYLASSTGLVRRIMSTGPLMYWGRASYSLYMTHNVTLWLLKYFLPEHHDLWDLARYGVYLFVIAVVAAWTYRTIEEPMRKWFISQKPAAPKIVQLTEAQT